MMENLNPFRVSLPSCSKCYHEGPGDHSLCEVNLATRSLYNPIIGGGHGWETTFPFLQDFPISATYFAFLDHRALNLYLSR
jgi:hypothetical protein